MNYHKIFNQFSAQEMGKLFSAATDKLFEGDGSWERAEKIIRTYDEGGNTISVTKVNNLNKMHDKRYLVHNLEDAKWLSFMLEQEIQIFSEENSNETMSLLANRFLIVCKPSERKVFYDRHLISQDYSAKKIVYMQKVLAKQYESVRKGDLNSEYKRIFTNGVYDPLKTFEYGTVETLIRQAGWDRNFTESLFRINRDIRNQEKLLLRQAKKEAHEIDSILEESERHSATLEEFKSTNSNDEAE